MTDVTMPKWTCASRTCTTIRRAMRSLFIEATVGFLSMTYLLLVIADLVVDELACECSVAEFTELLAGMGSNSSLCSERMLSGGPTCFSITFIEQKNSAAVKVDIVFLSIFFLEISLRVCCDGWQYFKNWVNALDVTVICFGLTFDIIYVQGSAATSFAIVRLGRMVRIVRIVNVVRRIIQSHRRVIRTRSRSIRQVKTPPQCHWQGTRNPLMLESSRSSVTRRSDGADGQPSVAGPRPPNKSRRDDRRSSWGLSTQLGFGNRCSVPDAFSPSEPRGEVGVFACFLSHMKSESAADARYIHHMLQMLLQADVYLDSSDLTDLRKLISEGLLRSDVVVWIASAATLQSPWVVIELWCAAESGTPLAVLYKPDFSHSATLNFLENYVDEMEVAAPKALQELRCLLQSHATSLRYAGDPNGNLRDLTDAIQKKLGLKQVVHAQRQHELNLLSDEVSCRASLETNEASSSLTEALKEAAHVPFYPYGSDEMMVRSLIDVCNAMAKLRGRELVWSEAEKPPLDETYCQGLCAQLKQLCHHLPQTKAPLKLVVAFDGAEANARRAAKFLQYSLQIKLSGPVAETGSARVDDLAEDEHYQVDITELIDEGVGAAESLMLVQTTNVLRRPSVLLQVFEAIRLGIPILCVNLEGGGYNFSNAKEYLRRLRQEYASDQPAAFHKVRTILHDRGKSWDEFQEVLKAHIPYMISSSFNHEWSVNMCNGFLDELTEKRAHAITSHNARSPEERQAEYLPSIEGERGSSRKKSVTRMWQSGVLKVVATSRISTGSKRNNTDGCTESETASAFSASALSATPAASELNQL